MNSQCFFIGTSLGDNPVPHHFVALANELVGRGHRVLILAPHRRTDLEKHDGQPAIYTWPSERPTNLHDARFLKDLFEKHHPSCLIANFAAVNLMLTVGWIERIPRRVAWYHTVTEQLVRDAGGMSFKNALCNWRKRFVYGRATHLVANSLASAADLKRHYRIPDSKVRLFHNSLADPACKLRVTGETPKPGKLICVGRLFPSKGQDVLIRALALLGESNPLLHVEFIGQGPGRGALADLASELGVRDRCHFIGQLGHAEVLQRMANAIATIVPSRSEAFGMVNIESMAVGTPVIASKVGGIVEIVRDGLDGLLVPPDDPGLLAAAMHKILSAPELRHQMHCEARKRFLSHFEQQRAVQEQADWFELITKAS
ncbi:MAG: glycosyltransferase family 4 protein [Verrucomicrobia bacterium]|nr:glycosyltransferase family 4 protein [Verrucomicrobiota bacterium]